jgi:cytochrome c556
MRLVGSFALATLVLGCSSPQAKATRALMQSPVVPASDAIFGAVVYANGQRAASPQIDAEWDRLREHARSLTTAATTLKTLAPADDPAQWIRQSDALGAASAAAIDAIAARSLDGVLEAGSRIYDTCTACHAAYAKDL